MSASYATIEPRDALWLEQSTYIASHLASIGYGLHVTVFFITARHLLQWHERSARNRIFWLGFLFLLLVFGTINITCYIKFNQSAWIDERNYPGGPYQFLSEQRSRPIVTVGNIASLLVTFMADGILLYRVIILWCSAWYVITLPILFFIGCLVLSILSIVQIVKPGFANVANLSLPVWLALMVLNIVLSGLIAIRLLMMRHMVTSGLGREYAKPYGMIAAVIVEAALPCTLLSIILLVLFGDKNITQSLFVSLFIQLECIAPALIILHVIIRQNATHVNPKQPLAPLVFVSPGINSAWSQSFTRHIGTNRTCAELLDSPQTKTSNEGSECPADQARRALV